MRKRRKSFDRSIIKLGNSRAITFPTEFLDSFRRVDVETGEDDFQGVMVRLFKIDPDTILVKKMDALNSSQEIQIDNDFPVGLVGPLLISAKKLNIGAVHIQFLPENQITILDICTEMGASPLISGPNEITVAFPNTVGDYTIHEKLTGILSYIEQIGSLIMDQNRDMVEDQRTIDTLLKTIDLNYRDAVRLVIHNLNNYYISDNNEEAKSIINFLGTRTLLFQIQNISSVLAKLFLFRNWEHIHLYYDPLKRFLVLLKRGTDINYDETITASPITVIEAYKHELDEYVECMAVIYQKAGKKIDVNSVESQMVENIQQNFQVVLSSLFDLMMTRWIESTSSHTD
jgi:hypothetical protein